MRVNAERIDKNKMVLEVEVATPEVNKAIERAAQRLAQKVNVPGFRKGKVPRKIMEARLGKAAVLEEAFDLIVPKAYPQALVDQNIEPVDRPEIEIVQLEENKPLVFKATVITKPEVELGRYKGLEVPKPKVAITDAEVDAQLEALRQRHAKLVVAENAAIQKGDFAIIDFEGFIDGKPFQGGNATGYPLEVGSGSFIPGFEDQLLGAKAGDSRDVRVTFPTDYPVNELAGKTAEFKVHIKDVKRREMPELDDDFAQEVFSGNLEELKADTRNKLEQAANARAEREYKNNALRQAVDNATVEIPPVMIEKRLQKMLEDFRFALERRGMTLEQYLQYTHSDYETLEQEYRISAERAVKTDLVLEQIVRQEKIQVSDAEVDAEIERMAAAYKSEARTIREMLVSDGRLESLKAGIALEKAADLIVQNAVAVEQ